MMTNSGMPIDPGSLPKAEFGFPGPLRDQLVAEILDEAKMSTTGLVDDYEHHREPLPTVGTRSVVVDSDDRPVAVIEVTSVRVAPLAQVALAHAVDEGEGFTTVSEWRLSHERFWESEDMRRALDDPAFMVGDATLVLLKRFRVIASLRAPR